MLAFAVEKNDKCTFQDIDKRKYLVPKDLSMHQFTFIIRKRIKLNPSQAIFLMINNTLCPSNTTIGEVYDEYHDEDGFLYIKYNGETPQIFLSDEEQNYYRNYYQFDKLKKPIMAIQVNGGVPDPNIQPGYNWARDLPLEIVTQLIEEYRDHYTIVNIKRPDQQGYDDTVECVDSPRGVAYLLQNSEKRIFIDSFAQHMSAALNLPSTVCWITTSPTVFGYDVHDNVFANPLKKDFQTTHQTFSQFELNESITDFPWDNGNDVIDINKIFQSVNKD